MSRVLLAGEQVTVYSVQVKGIDSFTTAESKEDGHHLVRALIEKGHAVDWQRSCDVPVNFPESLESLGRYDVVLLSDIGASSLLFHPKLLSTSKRRPNRLKLLEQFVAGGGGLVMIGGWMSFAGIEGKARYHGTPLEHALPVECAPGDDRVEVPEGIHPVVAEKGHPILHGVDSRWPYFLGYNRVSPKPEATVVLRLENDPLLCVWGHGKGRAAAFTSDCAPHWGPEEFLMWGGYALFWSNLVDWLNPAAGEKGA